MSIIHRVKWKRVLLLCAGLSAGAFFAIYFANVRDGQRPPQAAANPDDLLRATSSSEVVVDLEDGADLEDFVERYPDLLAGATVRWNSEHSEDSEAIALVSGLSPERQRALLARLRDDDQVESAEYNAIYKIEPGLNAYGQTSDFPGEEELPPLDGFPNDPLWGKQWNMRMVGATEAWDYAEGEGVIVAIIDTGVAYEDSKGLWAPDLQETLFVPGWDFVNDDAIAADDHGHGTHCAGTVAQTTNNGRGVVGLAPKARIMPLKVLNQYGSGYTSDIADAIRFAADNGAHVLSLSLGGGWYSQIMADAVSYARDKGCMVVCAAGNGGRNYVEYPARYPGATAVSSVGPSGELAFYSSYGKQVFIAAPGGDKSSGAEGGVLQNTLDPNRPDGTVYAYYQGTSMATPHVAAACALLYSHGVTRPEAIEAILRESATNPKTGETGGEFSKEYGWGVLNAAEALKISGSVKLLEPAPYTVAFVIGLIMIGFAFTFTTESTLQRVPLAMGGLIGACGLFFLAPLGIGSLPLIGPYLVRSPADWGLPLFGPSWHWCPLFASALIPLVVGFVSLAGTAVVRSAAVGLMLGWSSRLVAGILVPYADVVLIPGHGLLDGIWLAGNATILVAAAAAFTQIGRGKDLEVTS
jgi:serine protease